MLPDDDFGPGTADLLSAEMMGGLTEATVAYDNAVTYLRRKFTERLSQCQGLYTVCIEEIRHQLLSELTAGRILADDTTTNLVLGLRHEFGGIEELVAEAMRSLPPEPVAVYSFPVQGDSSPETPRGREPEPPVGEGCNDPGDRPRHPYPGLDALVYWENPPGRWNLPTPIQITGTLPMDFFGRTSGYIDLIRTGGGVIPFQWNGPTPWPPDVIGVVADFVNSQSQLCRLSADMIYTPPPPPPRPIGGQIQPPTPQPPIVPPPPPVPQPPPPTGGPPLIDINCPPADPCYPQPTVLISEGVFRPPPLPAHFWLFIKCLDACSADIKCYQGDCPPPNPGGYQQFGPLQRCPSPVEMSYIVRECLGVPPPPRPRPTLVPPLSVDGPRPPGFQPPPQEPPEEPSCEAFESHPPRWAALTPNCTDERVFFGPIFDRAMAFRNVKDAVEAIKENYDDSTLEQPSWLGGDEEIPIDI